jgi:hypothetical protein
MAAYTTMGGMKADNTDNGGYKMKRGTKPYDWFISKTKAAQYGFQP